jgi:glycosyltransferase involved in cell wall biosynthesis
MLLTLGETSASYNEHCLPVAHQRRITICTYFKPTVAVPNTLQVFAGDDTFLGFLRAFRAALAQGPYDIIHVHSIHLALFLLVVNWFWGGRLNRRAVYTVHNSYPNYKWRNRIMLLFAFAWFNKIVCCSRASYTSFPALYKQLAGKRLSAVQNGTDLERIDRVLASLSPSAPHPFQVTILGRLIEIKNPFVALRAFQASALPNSQLVFIGEGHLKQPLLAEVAAHSPSDQIVMRGLIPRDEVYAALAATDVFLSPSWGEGLPVAVIEAMACGCPVILSDIPPHREIAGSVDFIPLIPPADVAGFAQALTRFHALSPNERKELGRKCRRLIEEHFSLTAMHQGYLAIYEQVLRSHPA